MTMIIGVVNMEKLITGATSADFNVILENFRNEFKALIEEARTLTDNIITIGRL